jgi:hypothetical protein
MLVLQLFLGVIIKMPLTICSIKPWLTEVLYHVCKYELEQTLDVATPLQSWLTMVPQSFHA